MTVHLRLLLIACMLQAGQSISLAEDAEGWVEEDCVGATFHVVKFAEASAARELVLRLTSSHIPLAYLRGAGWLDVQGQRCSGIGKCEELTHAKIWLDEGKGSIRRVSGKYSVDFGDQHLEQQFVVKYRKHKGRPPICE